MFGYIQIDEKELSDQDTKIYGAYYCGLCQCLKKDFGIRGQLLVNYDMAFLTVLLSGLYRFHQRSAEFICPVHPGKKKTALVNDATRYAAAMSVLLSYHNIQEELAEDKSYSKIMILRLLEKDYQKVSKEYPRQHAALVSYVRQRADFESNREQNMDAIAGLTGDMLGEIYAWRNDECGEELRYLGYHVGKFIYLMDAYTDLDKDSKKKEYNPFITMDMESPKDTETISRLILNSLISECARSYERLPAHSYGSIVRNILYYGVWKKYESLHSKRMKRQERSDKKDYRIMARQKKNEIRDLKKYEKKIIRLEQIKEKQKKQTGD
ncbi:MAG: hypothetical protein IJV59_08440 [Eubacterium sp.]|nr:hypothetical protein [Eubacterium sp.]MBQ9022445.1 hypothetical protein [Eubacterium sp.]